MAREQAVLHFETPDRGFFTTMETGFWAMLEGIGGKEELENLELFK